MKKTINISDDIFHIEDGNLHREKGPAIEFKDGICWWMQKGKLHRDNGPAITGKKEIVEYWLNGEPASEEEIKNIKRNKWIDKTI
jgi:hypothetical protein